MRAALRDEADFLAEWVAAGRVQTNEVQRCWWLLPCFLEVARRHGADTVDCLELGCSGGLNLVWDRYGYRYEGGTFGPSNTVSLIGRERGSVPRGLLALRPRVRSRVGVDAAPPDLRTEEGVLTLKAFVWAGQEARLARLDAAVDAWRRDPPEIVRGDILDELPQLLAGRRDEVPLVVWQTAVFNYLPRERRERIRELIRDAGVAFVETWWPKDGSHEYYGLFVDGDEVAHADFHGAWIDWLA